MRGIWHDPVCSRICARSPFFDDLTRKEWEGIEKRKCCMVELCCDGLERRVGSCSETEQPYRVAVPYQLSKDTRLTHDVVLTVFLATSTEGSMTRKTLIRSDMTRSKRTGGLIDMRSFSRHCLVHTVLLISIEGLSCPPRMPFCVRRATFGG